VFQWLTGWGKSDILLVERVLLMLVLTRRTVQVIMVGDDVEVTITEVRGEQVRIGVRAPREMSVHRKEIWEEIKTENRAAAGTQQPPGGPAT
jgi:carbon storage regulator